MTKVILFLCLFTIIGCGTKEVNCGSKIPQFTNCIDGEFICFDNYIKVEGVKTDLGCVKKGQYDFRCINPCLPYNQILLTSNSFLPKDKMISTFFITDFGNINNPNDWNSPAELQLFIDSKFSNTKQLHLTTDGICDLYRFWNEDKKAFSQAKVNAVLNETKDTLIFNCRYGWDKSKNFEENECNLIFIKDKNLQ